MPSEGATPLLQRFEQFLTFQVKVRDPKPNALNAKIQIQITKSLQPQARTRTRKPQALNSEPRTLWWPFSSPLKGTPILCCFEAVFELESGRCAARLARRFIEQNSVGLGFRV